MSLTMLSWVPPCSPEEVLGGVGQGPAAHCVSLHGTLSPMAVSHWRGLQILQGEEGQCKGTALLTHGCRTAPAWRKGPSSSPTLPPGCSQGLGDRVLPAPGQGLQHLLRKVGALRTLRMPPRLPSLPLK